MIVDGILKAIYGQQSRVNGAYTLPDNLELFFAGKSGSWPVHHLIKEKKPIEIKVFGPGCARCTETENLVKEVTTAKGGNITVQKMSDLKERMLAGVMSTPAVAIDGVVKSTGKAPTKEEIAAWIDGTVSAPSPATPAGGCCGGEKCC